MSEVYDRYVDTAGNYHYTDAETGHHVIRKSCGYCHEDSDGYGGRMYKKFVQDEVLDNGIIKGHMELIKTNADRIRSMTDEEIAEWYWWMLKHVQGYTDSRIALTDWLKEEVKSIPVEESYHISSG